MNQDVAAIAILQNALKAANLRQQVYANNIANAQTPGFHSSNVQFQSLLTQALLGPTGGAPTSPGSTPFSGFNWSAGIAVQPRVVTNNQTEIANNGNNVNIDAQMARLAENQVYYNTLVQDVQSHLTRLQTAITG